MVKNIMADYRQFRFAPAKQYKWSPSNSTIYFSKDMAGSKNGLWSLLHELGHALLGHREFSSDIELIKIERAAWDRALMVAGNYGLSIDENYIEDCMDTYRHWLSERSRCPQCQHTGLQLDGGEYNCINCNCSWQVSDSQACKVVRHTTKKPA